MYLRSRQPHYKHMETHVVAFIGFWNAHPALQKKVAKINPVIRTSYKTKLAESAEPVQYKIKLVELPASH